MSSSKDKYTDNKRETEPEQLKMDFTYNGEVDLSSFGFAPGDYMGWCRQCEGPMLACTKRSTKCKQCAMQRYLKPKEDDVMLVSVYKDHMRMADEEMRMWRSKALMRQARIDEMQVIIDELGGGYGEED